MRRTHLALIALIPALALGYSACVGEPETDSDEAVAVEEAAVATHDPALLGTYRDHGNLFGAASLLVFMADGTYHRARMVACVTGPCPPVAEDGRFVTGALGPMTFVTLLPDTMDTSETYRYTLVRDTLWLRKLGDRSWVSLDKTPEAAWCDEPKHCALQNLLDQPCPTRWQCQSNTCSNACVPHLPLN